MIVSDDGTELTSHTIVPGRRSGASDGTTSRPESRSGTLSSRASTGASVTSASTSTCTMACRWHGGSLKPGGSITNACWPNTSLGILAERVCIPVPTGPRLERILVMSEGNKGQGHDQPMAAYRMTAPPNRAVRVPLGQWPDWGTGRHCYRRKRTAALGPGCVKTLERPAAVYKFQSIFGRFSPLQARRSEKVRSRCAVFGQFPSFHTAWVDLRRSPGWRHGLPTCGLA